ncbi:hypothetical protein [Methanoculleus taiwanensis]|nr:hypothetical protein [Methanoculleus taiwanensis]
MAATIMRTLQVFIPFPSDGLHSRGGTVPPCVPALIPRRSRCVIV